jgi:hypothetical protein
MHACVQTHLSQWEGQVDQNQVFYRHQTLCETISGNSVPLLTITAQPRGSQREDVEELCMYWHAAVHVHLFFFIMVFFSTR